MTEMVSIAEYLKQQEPPPEPQIPSKLSLKKVDLRADNWEPVVNSEGVSLETLSEWGVYKRDRYKDLGRTE